ncbi:hypothetical protein BU14_0361s0006 [Porphyra umbilicalis]|uniref:Uncharacterized protein n=1 Tax=Porphyra umbilicalis TaxID=2786 RepID=A0A1X6NXF4_PORUM|nr:hypothetical protein BU14_0361s0006 [Porphyra umbilicalis]|eukprot:OSX73278.1 hypothetical protein BU14_0361s0006 [Porphyra umbilicalis]
MWWRRLRLHGPAAAAVATSVAARSASGRVPRRGCGRRPLPPPPPRLAGGGTVASGRRRRCRRRNDGWRRAAGGEEGGGTGGPLVCVWARVWAAAPPSVTAGKRLASVARVTPLPRARDGTARPSVAVATGDACPFGWPTAGGGPVGGGRRRCRRRRCRNATKQRLLLRSVLAEGRRKWRHWGERGGGKDAASTRTAVAPPRFAAAAWRLCGARHGGCAAPGAARLSVATFSLPSPRPYTLPAARRPTDGGAVPRPPLSPSWPRRLHPLGRTRGERVGGTPPLSSFVATGSGGGGHPCGGCHSPGRRADGGRARHRRRRWRWVRQQRAGASDGKRRQAAASGGGGCGGGGGGGRSATAASTVHCCRGMGGAAGRSRPHHAAAAAAAADAAVAVPVIGPPRCRRPSGEGTTARRRVATPVTGGGRGAPATPYPRRPCTRVRYGRGGRGAGGGRGRSFSWCGTEMV